MRCPYCGAEAVGRRCIYCGSDLLEFIKQNNLSLDDFETEEAESKKKEPEQQKGPKNRTDALAAIRELCSAFIQKHDDEFGSYDTNFNLTGGKAVKDRLFDVLQIPAGAEVFLIHDDTLFKSGKNGFAITDQGFHCQELLEKLVITDFDSILSNDTVSKGNCIVRIDREEQSLIYYAAAGKVQDALETLCKKIIAALY